MPSYIIGLDFGTYQTKASINHLDKLPQKHEFFEFINNGNKSFFIPSKVSFLKSGLVAYGLNSKEEIDYEFNYFKIASAEDERFQVLSGLSGRIYTNENSFHGYSPEFLSVIFITDVLLIIKEHYNSS